MKTSTATLTEEVADVIVAMANALWFLDTGHGESEEYQAQIKRIEGAQIVASGLGIAIAVNTRCNDIIFGVASSDSVLARI